MVGQKSDLTRTIPPQATEVNGTQQAAKTEETPQTAPDSVHPASEVKNPDSFIKGELYALGRGVYKFERAYKNERGHSFYVFKDTKSGVRETFSNAQLKEAVVSARKLERKQEALQSDEPTLEELEGIEKETAGPPQVPERAEPPKETVNSNIVEEMGKIGEPKPTSVYSLVGCKA
ncbi:MAG: hypothetical protein LBC93_00395 [Synergistaceae bacterium]|nr:hypothetical protein [Synergistaceae bacterium]